MNRSLPIKQAAISAVVVAAMAGGATLVMGHSNGQGQQVQKAREAGQVVHQGAPDPVNYDKNTETVPAGHVTSPLIPRPSPPPTSPPASAYPPPIFLYRAQVGPWANIPLQRIQNVSVEQLPGAWLLGSVTFTTNDPRYACLSGHALNAWSVPSHPSVILVHDGDQGPQCTYGTWVYRPFYTGGWKGVEVGLTWHQNVTVEGLGDASPAGQLLNFQTDNPYYASLDGATRTSGETLNVWSAPKEFPGELVAHNGDEGSQPVYITLLLP